jgi:CRISPR-associated protein Csd1
MLDALATYAEQHDLVLQPGFTRKFAAWALWLDEQGRLVDLLDLRGSDKRGQAFENCPDLQQHELIAGEGGRSHFLLDTLDVVTLYQVEKLPDRKQTSTLRKHSHFVRLLREAAAEDPQLGVCADFLERPEALAQIHATLAVQKAKPVDRVTFRVGDQFVVDSDGWHRWWVQFRQNLNGKPAQAQGQLMRCLQTGDLVAPARVHPKIKGLSRELGGQPSGCVLIGFDKEAFRSYGLEQSSNAAVSESAATVYTSALNDLIGRAGRPLAGSLLVHWYRDTVSDDDDFMTMLRGAIGTTTAQQETEALARARRLLTSVRDGKRPDLANNRFHAAMLSAAGGRLMVRAWFEDTFAAVASNVSQWFEDLAICESDNGPPAGHGMWNILRSLVRKDPDELPPALAIALWRAALLGESIPFAILSPALHRIRVDAATAERIATSARMAIVKALLVRTARDKSLHSKVGIYLNEAHPSPAYQAGRLMAVLSQLQRSALGDVGAGVVQRYYASACATPGLVLGTLVRQSQNHLAKLDRGLAFWYEEKMASILSRVTDGLPRTTTLEEQSLFALGYYQQLADLRHPKDKSPDNTKEDA